MAGQCCIDRTEAAGTAAARSPQPFCSAIFRQSLTIAEIKEPSVASARQPLPRPAVSRAGTALGSAQGTGQGQQELSKDLVMGIMSLA